MNSAVWKKLASGLDLLESIIGFCLLWLRLILIFVFNIGIFLYAYLTMVIFSRLLVLDVNIALGVLYFTLILRLEFLICRGVRSNMPWSYSRSDTFVITSSCLIVVVRGFTLKLCSDIFVARYFFTGVTAGCWFFDLIKSRNRYLLRSIFWKSSN